MDPAPSRPRGWLRPRLARLAPTLALLASCLDGGAPAEGRPRLHDRPRPIQDACVELRPVLLDFGGTRVGEVDRAEVLVVACGAGALVVTNVELASGGSPAFRVDPVGLPVVIPPGAAWSFPVTFEPIVPGGRDALGTPLRDHALVRLAHNAAVGPTTLAVRGYAW